MKRIPPLWPIREMVPACIIALALVLSAGCAKKEAATPKPIVTVENLQTAYGRETKLLFMYTRLMQRADRGGNKAIGRLFRALARSEEVHARRHAALLQSQGVKPAAPSFDSVASGTALQGLRMAFSSEGLETSAMYPSLIKAADAEKYADASIQFRQTLDADIRHAELLKSMIERGGKRTLPALFVCPGCGYIATSERRLSECPGCRTTFDKFERI